MAEGKTDYSDSDEESSTHKADVKKCHRRLDFLKISPHGKSRWYRGTPKHAADTPDGEDKQHSKSSTLISAITAGDVGRSAQLLDVIPLRSLNKLSSVSISQGTFKVTPLLWAVIQSQIQIVQLLIEKEVNVDRQGYLENDDVVYTYTPLIRALDKRDSDIVSVLLESGADPYLRVSGPRISEEEGSAVRYTTWLYPATKAIDTDDVDTVRVFMEKYNPSTVYTSNHHTCLCFTLSKPKLANRHEIVKCIISHGGKVCDGTEAESLMDKGICSHLKILIRKAFSMIYTMDEVKFRCNLDTFRVLSLVCKTDYAKPNSTIAKTLQQYFNFFGKDTFTFGARYGFVCQRSQQCLTYMMNYSKAPAPLKRICRVVIRNRVESWNPTTCFKLPLPSQLQRYVGLMEED